MPRVASLFINVLQSSSSSSLEEEKDPASRWGPVVDYALQEAQNEEESSESEQLEQIEELSEEY